jgi:hypothetical protein
MLFSVIKHWIVLEFAFFFYDGRDCKVVHHEALTFTFPWVEDFIGRAVNKRRKGFTSNDLS